jgi:hypothetical protein
MSGTVRHVEGGEHPDFWKEEVNMFHGDIKFASDNVLKRLVGATITESILTEDGESYGFRAEKGGKSFIVWVDCDPEGNGPGWLQIEDAESTPSLADAGDTSVTMPAETYTVSGAQMEKVRCAASERKHINLPVTMSWIKRRFPEMNFRECCEALERLPSC